MNALLLTLAFTTSLLTQCGTHTAQSTEAASNATQQATRSANKPSKDESECDFSAYAPVRIEHFDKGAVTKRVKPEYPPEAMKRGIQGQVVVKTIVNEEGIVERSCAVEGEDMLRHTAEIAALRWKLKPGYGLAFLRPKTKTNPKNYAEIYIVFNFKLNEAGSKGVTTVQP